MSHMQSISNPSTYVEQGDHGHEIAPSLLDGVESEATAGVGEADPEPVDVTSGYVSDSELMLWLQDKSAQQSSALREQLNLSTDRTHYIEALTDLKGQIDGNGHADQILQSINDVLADPQNAAFTAELELKLHDCIEKLQNADPPNLTLAEDALKNTKADLEQLVDGQIDKFNKLDGLALVQIQQLAADQRETSGLVSSLLASSNQTANTIIGNYRG